MKSGAAVSIFPEGPQGKGKTRMRAEAPGEKRVDIVGFRPRVPDQLEWYRAQKAKNYSNSDLLTKISDLAIDIERELGDGFRKIEALAALENLSAGTIIGRLVKKHLAEIEARLSRK